MNKTLSYICCLALLSSCIGRNKTSVNDKNIDTASIAENINIRPKSMYVPLYDEIENYSNNLSAIGSSIRFVKLDETPLLRDFFINDIQQTDKDLFIQGSEYIYKYDASGKFVKQIGGRGQGPAEYVNLNPPIQLDPENQLLYASDLKTLKCIIYDFNGNFKKTIKVKEGQESICLLDSLTIAVRTGGFYRFLPYETPLIIIQDNNRKNIKSYKSSLYPVPRTGTESFGNEVNPLWNCQNSFYTMEYGNDTIYQITKDKLTPSLLLTGSLALDKNELFTKDLKDKVYIGGSLTKPNSYIFESNRFIIARLISKKNGDYFAIFDKKTGNIQRTGKQITPYWKNYYKRKNAQDYFIDDLVSNLPIDPLYQSEGEAIGIIPASSIVEERENILDYIAKHPTEEGENLKKIVAKITEEDNSVLCFIRFK